MLYGWKFTSLLFTSAINPTLIGTALKLHYVKLIERPLRISLRGLFCLIKHCVDALIIAWKNFLYCKSFIEYEKHLFSYIIIKYANKVGKENCMPEFKTVNQSKIITGDSLDYLKKMPDNSVDLIVTSHITPILACLTSHQS